MFPFVLYHLSLILIAYGKKGENMSIHVLFIFMSHGSGIHVWKLVAIYILYPITSQLVGDIKFVNHDHVLSKIKWLLALTL